MSCLIFALDIDINGGPKGDMVTKRCLTTLLNNLAEP